MNLKNYTEFDLQHILNMIYTTNYWHEPINYFTGGYMKAVYTTLLICFCFVLTLRAEDWNKVRQTIEEMNNKLEKSIVEGDMSYQLSYYTEDAISMPDFEPALKGITEIKKSMENNMKSGMKVTSADFKTTDLIGSGDLAVELGEWNMTMAMPGNTSPMNQTGKYITVWQKQADNTWKVKADTWNTNSNPSMMSEGEKTNTDEMK